MSKKRQRTYSYVKVIECVCAFSLFTLIFYGASWFVLDDLLIPLLVAVPLSAWFTYRIMTAETTTKITGRKRKRIDIYADVFGGVFAFLMLTVLLYGVSWFVLDNSVTRLLVAVALSAGIAYSMAKDKAKGIRPDKIQRGQKVRCPSCMTMTITVKRRGGSATCKQCKNEFTWSQIVAEEKIGFIDT